MNPLSVLSFGSTRSLWEGPQAEDYQRLMAYAAHLERYVIVANSYKRHRLRPLALAPNVTALPVDAFTPLDGFFRQIVIGSAVLRREKMSLIQAQEPFYSGLAAVWLGRRFRLPVNTCVFGANVHDPLWLASEPQNRLLAPLGRYVLRASQGIQVDGQLTAQRLLAAGYDPERVAVKPMAPANLGAFLRTERAAAVADRPVRMLFVGRFAPQKNLPLMLEAMAELREKLAAGTAAPRPAGGTPAHSSRWSVKGPRRKSCAHWPRHAGWRGASRSAGRSRATRSPAYMPVRTSSCSAPITKAIRACSWKPPPRRSRSSRPP